MDIDRLSFDHDLTLAILLANADGTVYHRYGGRDSNSPMNIESLVALMREGVHTHRQYRPVPQATAPMPPLRVRELIQDRLQGRIQATFGCYHCHYVREARQYLALEEGRWTPDQFWIWPETERLGLVMDQQRQNRVLEVLAGSAADSAGLQPGDQLQWLQGIRVLTKCDIQSVLDQSPGEATTLSYALLRVREMREGSLALGAAWKVGDPADYLWRVRSVSTEHMIKFLPAPGFIGETLSASELAALGLQESRFAIKVTQLNHGTYLAGIRLGDIILGADNRSDFTTSRDFYQACEMMRRAGRDIRMEILRLGAVMKVMVGQEHLNDSRVAKAPRVLLGFIVQELPGTDGLRVGHVTDDSSAEKTGLLIGDRIVAIDGRDVGTRNALDGILNSKSPGDLITWTVRRDGKRLYFGYVLPGEDMRRSDLARLSETVTHPGQLLSCTVSIKLPAGDHIYSVHKKGFGVPTLLDFRGHGYRLVGEVQEPPPREMADPGVTTMWVLEGDVELKQIIEVTDSDSFQLLLRVYAQVCDEERCHEFQAIIVSDGRTQGFMEFHGKFEVTPEID